jgi:hypothetical protein
MESNITTPTIVQLWGEFDGLVRLSIPHLTKLVSPAYNVDAARRPEYERQLKQCNERLAELRDQLIERIETEWGMKIKQVKRNGIPEIMAVFDHGVLFLNSNDADDLGSCLKFAAWELEQRQKGQSTT